VAVALVSFAAVMAGCVACGFQTDTPQNAVESLRTAPLPSIPDPHVEAPECPAGFHNAPDDPQNFRWCTYTGPASVGDTGSLPAIQHAAPCTSDDTAYQIQCSTAINVRLDANQGRPIAHLGCLDYEDGFGRYMCPQRDRLVPNVFTVTIAGSGACPGDGLVMCAQEFDSWYDDVGLDDEFLVSHRPDDTPIAAQVAQCLPDDPGTCEGELVFLDAGDTQTGGVHEEWDCAVVPAHPFDTGDDGGCSPYYKPVLRASGVFPWPTCDCTCEPVRFPYYASPALPPDCPSEDQVPPDTGTSGDETGATGVVGSSSGASST
jgi:hypothetical protein